MGTQTDSLPSVYCSTLRMSVVATASTYLLWKYTLYKSPFNRRSFFARRKQNQEQLGQCSESCHSSKRKRSSSKTTAWSLVNALAKFVCSGTERLLAQPRQGPNSVQAVRLLAETTGYFLLTGMGIVGIFAFSLHGLLLCCHSTNNCCQPMGVFSSRVLLSLFSTYCVAVVGFQCTNHLQNNPGSSNPATVPFVTVYIIFCAATASCQCIHRDLGKGMERFTARCCHTPSRL
jgi:hypothetical protein